MCEIQLTTVASVKVKKVQHKVYEVLRASANILVSNSSVLTLKLKL